MKALITGASSGIGLAFARKLASINYELVILARSQETLETLAEELTVQCGVQTQVIVQDLTVPNVGAAIAEAVNGGPESIDLLVNNAGFGDYGEFSDRPMDKTQDMIQLNIMALTDLIGSFLPAMQKRGTGSIINVASIVGFLPIPYMAVYAATKSYVLSFSESLWLENKDTGVCVLALCPGPTESNFFKVAEFPGMAGEGVKGPGMINAERVVEEALNGLTKQQPNIVTGGLLSHVIANIARFLPRAWVVSIVGKQFSPATIAKKR
ncbi:MAG: SDR family oxidoreductase [Cyanobacteria bacterium P01_H01_bin.15]